MADISIPEVVQQAITDTCALLKESPDLKGAAEVFEKAYPYTLTHTTTYNEKTGSTFVVTGDIPAMWLRDSSAQLAPYLPLTPASDYMYKVLAGLVKTHTECIHIDPYANAFNQTANGSTWDPHDVTEASPHSPWIWERKWEVDSLCYAVDFAHRLWKVSGRRDHLTPVFHDALRVILTVFQREQNRNDANVSKYRFTRPSPPAPASDTLSHNGRGAPVEYTGLIWSGFRPSDDACVYGYHIPSNIFAVLVLAQITEIAREIFQDMGMVRDACLVRAEVVQGLYDHALVDTHSHGKILAYEVDGKGNTVLMDDANIPSLLSTPYFGFLEADEPEYVQTRKFILSEHNPYYFHGSVTRGIGSPHAPKDHVWPLSIIMQGLTSGGSAGQARAIAEVLKTDCGCHLMHESVHTSDVSKYTRPFFGWANALFSQLVLEWAAHHTGAKGTPVGGKRTRRDRDDDVDMA